MKPLPYLIVILAAILIGSTDVRADLILDSIPNAVWDRTFQPIGPSPVTFRVFSDLNVPTENQMNAFSLGIRIVPTAGASGSLAIQSVAASGSNSVFNPFAIPPVLANLGGGLQTISGENAVFSNVTIPQTGRNLFTAQFFSPGNDALGLFEVYADRDTTSYFTTTEFDGLKYSNVPAAGPAPGTLLGSFQVNASAVPEPSSAFLAIASLGLVSLARRFRKARRSV
jgi:hypothetical protein